MGASQPEEMVLRAKKLGYRGLALCDVNGMYGVGRGYQAAHKPNVFDAEELAAQAAAEAVSRSGASGFRYHVGAELTPFDTSPVTLLPTSKDGYARLSRLITRVKRPAGKGRLKLSLSELIEDAGFASGELLAIPHPPWNSTHLEALVDAFGDRLFLPVCKDSTWESIRLAREALAFEKRLGPSGLKLFATQRPLFHIPERKPLHDVLTCLLHKTTLHEAKTKLALNSERHLKPLSELQQLYRDRPDLLSRTMEISERLQFSLKELKYKYPREALPPGMTSEQFMRSLVEKGIQWRYPAGTEARIRERARQQVEHELKLIQELEYEDYFLTLWDICQFARDRGILHQGRGSAANSIVCYALGLTAIDPIKLGLLFERFLSRERSEPPDIDIDFEHERREEVIQYIYQKYGAAHAAMVCTTICYRSRMAVRDVARTMSIPSQTVDELIKFMGREGLSRLLNSPTDIARFGLTPEKFRTLVQRAGELKGFPRHLGIHSGGFVISHEPIVDIVPVEAATMTGRYVVQWNKDDVNLLGLMKIDVLSLGMLSAVQKSFTLLREKKQLNYDLSTIPQEDPKTYAMIQKAETIGVFQIESRAQMSLLPRLKPKTWYDLVIEVAIVRPGPIQGGMVNPYLKRRTGTEKVTYAHEKLKPILEKTLGIPLFQEQIMQIAVAVAGFTPGEADELRRVVSSAWKKKAVMIGLRNRIVNGMLANGLTVEYADQIYKTIEGFASYGFPESHAASFALITYASCWLKCHHPDVFVTALLNSQPMGFYPPRQLIADARKNGVPFLPLDIQTSNWDYTLHPASQHLPLQAVRIGLRSIQGLGREESELILFERNQRGPFASLEDLVQRARISRKAISRLATAGALYRLEADSRRALYRIQGLDFNQQSLFFGTEPLDAKSDGREQIKKENEWESVRREFSTKGYSLDSHPMKILRPILTGQAWATTLATLRNNSAVTITGLKTLVQKPPTAKGLCFLSLEDETGIFNIVVMPDLYERYRLVIGSSQLLEVRGQIQNRYGVCHVRATHLSSPSRETLLRAMPLP